MLGRFKLGKVGGRRLLMGTLWLGVAAGAYFWGRSGSLSEASASPSPTSTEGAQPVPSGRVVGYIHETVPVTREELGEFLIQRYGKDKIKHLINKKIIDHAAKAKGIEVTASEVQAAITADAVAAGARTVKEFNDVILKRYNKTDYEWREDVVRPRLILERLSRARVTVSRVDLANAYDAHYGPKVDCKMIIFPKDERNHVLNKVWPAVRKSDEEFDHYARMQASPSLAAVAGHIKPIGRHTTGSENLEKVLFGLKPGEVSHVLDEAEGLVIVKCLQHLKENTSVTFDQVKDKLEKEVFDKKVVMEIGVVFKELYAQAKPTNFLEPANSTEEVRKSLGIQPPTESAPVPPAGSLPVPQSKTPTGK